LPYASNGRWKSLSLFESVVPLCVKYPFVKYPLQFSLDGTETLSLELEFYFGKQKKLQACMDAFDQRSYNKNPANENGLK